MSEVVAGGEHKQGDLRGVLPAGTSLRGYELKSILGQGAFGIGVIEPGALQIPIRDRAGRGKACGALRVPAGHL